MNKDRKRGFFSFLKKNKGGHTAAAERETPAEAGNAGLPEEAGDADEPGVAAEGRSGFFQKLRGGLKKTRGSMGGRLAELFKRGAKIDDDLLEEIEEMLIGVDLGVQTTMAVVENIRKTADNQVLADAEALKQTIKDELLRILEGLPEGELQLNHQPTILLVVGVNGVGKTTTIGKIANHFKSLGKSVTLCAADTFRAAAVEQLEVWARRAGVEIVHKAGGKDPAAVVYDALEKVQREATDVLLIDTAGRLHNNPNLMNELSKIHRIIAKSIPSAPHHVLLILDAVTGQNGLQQAKQFLAKVKVTDLVITKLDGTAKGGIALAIAKELNLPIQFVGVGEKMDDLLPFDARAFVHSLFED